MTFHRDSAWLLAGAALLMLAASPAAVARPGQWGGSGGSWQGGTGDFAGQLTCRSERNRERFCAADVRGRAMVVQQQSRAPCIEGETWRAETDGIRVRNGCQARFAYGYVGDSWGGGFGGSGGSWQTGDTHKHHDNTGAVVAGGLLAAGLVAALVAAGKSGKATHNHVARVEANYGLFPAGARDEARACLGEAARQVGATGGDSVRLDRVVRSTQQPGGGWRLQAQLTKAWPDHRQSMRMDCVASGGRVSAFDVS
ncbi:MAG: DUF3011 domain-containing protein [Sphingomonadaceae bacterium]